MKDLSKNQRMVLFFGVCIPVRLLFVLIAKKSKNNVLTALIAFMISLGFMYQFNYIPTKPGVFGGKPWWNRMRVFHATTYLCYAIFSLTGYEHAWKFLGLDVLAAIMSGIYQFA
jgi:hypothetical protein